jgi:hypothetical protein
VTTTDTAENGGVGRLSLTVDEADTEVLANLHAKAATVAQLRRKMQLGGFMGAGSWNGHLLISCFSFVPMP